MAEKLLLPIIYCKKGRKSKLQFVLGVKSQVIQTLVSKHLFTGWTFSRCEKRGVYLAVLKVESHLKNNLFYYNEKTDWVHYADNVSISFKSPNKIRVG
jgi:hypothetical protein